jgi:hypothetical protein
VAEIPTIWLDRQAGVSNFRVAKWIPSYLHWYRFAFGTRLTAEQIRAYAASAEPRATAGPGTITEPGQPGPVSGIMEDTEGN